MTGAAGRPLRLVMVTNIPTPYRIHQFNVLHAHLREVGVGFEVVFLAARERRRHWKVSLADARFPFHFAWGFTVELRKQPLFFNPGVVVDVLRRPPTWLVLGGAWYIPTMVAAAVLGRLRGSSWCLGWSESTAQDQHIFPGRFIDRVKRLLHRSYEGWVTSGRRAEQLARALTSQDARVIQLSNIVDEAIYRDGVALARTRRSALRERFRVSPEQRLLLWPARLSPEKGILPFLAAIEGVGPERYRILIAGEGPQRAEIEAYLRRSGNESVVLLGQLTSEVLVELYAAADVLLLPSLSEPFGYVIVEAATAGLPLFVSDRAGAVPEAVRPGENGWVVDPADAAGVRRSFEDLLATGPEALADLGRNSARIAAEAFDSRQGVVRFFDALQKVFPPKRR